MFIYAVVGGCSTHKVGLAYVILVVATVCFPMATDWGSCASAYLQLWNRAALLYFISHLLPGWTDIVKLNLDR